jgi:nucleotide-binding universal stress UspA family protein
MDSRKIVVGVDGSPASVAAARWAALEAQRSGVELEILVAYHWRMPGVLRAARTERIKEVEDRVAAIADAAVTEARAAAPRATVHGKAVLGEPAPVLVEAGDRAGLLVVGNRGGGGFASLLAGSVSVRVATQASCPVVVVRGDAGRDTGPVVVGVDGSAPADIALTAAFEEASRRRSSLTAVHTYTEPLTPWPVGMQPIGYDTDTVRADLSADLVNRTAGWRDKYPDVPVDHVVAKGGAAASLTTLSQDAQLVVVGTRGHSTTGELLLGSVGLQLLHHAACPVLIVRSEAQSTGGQR